MNNLIKKIISEIEEESKVKIKFFLHIIILNLSIRGRFNFLNMARFGKYNEKSYRNNFKLGFPFLIFNIAHIKSRKFKELILVGDASFIKKSGKKTYGLWYFWSGVASKVLKGLEIHSIGAIDITNNQAYHLHAMQSPLIYLKIFAKAIILELSTGNKQKLIESVIGKKSSTANKVDFYTNHFISNAKELLRLSKYIAYDGFAYKFNFVDPLCKSGFEIVSKLRKDANLRYIYDGELKVGRGRKKKYGQKIDYKNIPEKYLKETTEDDGIETKIFQMNMWHKKFVNLLNIVVIVKRDIAKKRVAHTILFCTNLDLDYKKIIDYYSLRFQIEFIFRDAKQHWGMEDFMNINKIAVNNFTNLSTFMVNFSYSIREKMGDKKMSIIDLKAHFHGLKYANEVLKLLPKITDAILLNKLYNKITTIGAIEEKKNVA